MRHTPIPFLFIRVSQWVGQAFSQPGPGSQWVRHTLSSPQLRSHWMGHAFLPELNALCLAPQSSFTLKKIQNGPAVNFLLPTWSTPHSLHKVGQTHISRRTDCTHQHTWSFLSQMQHQLSPTNLLSFPNTFPSSNLDPSWTHP